MKIQFILFAAIAAFTTLAVAGPVNTTCPVSGLDIKPGFTVTIGEETVGFCCARCQAGFQKWDEAKQVAYVAEQKAMRADKPVVKTESKYAVNTPYLLDSCPITGLKLGEMGDPIVEVIDGREVRFCCNACPEKFKANKAEMFAKLDKQMIANQLPYYPLTTCIISGEELDINGKPVDFIYGNRLFRVCCNDCKEMFIENPTKLIAELDEAIIKAQSKDYPLTACVVGKGPLDGMGEPDLMIVGNRLVKLCCKDCRAGVLKDPLAIFAMIDAATE